MKHSFPYQKLVPRIIANRADSSVEHQDDEDAAPEAEAGQVLLHWSNEKRAPNCLGYIRWYKGL